MASRVTDWQPQGQWTWTTSNADVGDNQVEVRIIDGKHAGQDSADDSKTAAFAITAPNQKPAIARFGPDKAAPQDAGATVTLDSSSQRRGEKSSAALQIPSERHPRCRLADLQSVGLDGRGDRNRQEFEVQVRDGKHADAPGLDRSKCTHSR